MRFLKYVLIVIVVIIAAVLVIGLIKKGPVTITRSIVIKAPKSVVWENISAFKKFDNWNPFDDEDTAVKKTFSTPDGVVGAKYLWDGKKIGSGSQTYTAMNPNDSIAIDLEFTKPFEAQNQVIYKIEGEDGNVKVSWIMHSNNGIFMAAMSTIMRMENMLNEKFDKGLATLKKICEENKVAVAPEVNYKVEETTMPAFILACTENKQMEFKNLSKDWYGKQYGMIMAYIGKNKLSSKNHAYTLNKNVDKEMTKGDLYPGMDVGTEAASADGVMCMKVAGGKCLKVVYFGDYMNMQSAYGAIVKYALEHKLSLDYSVEHYVNDPESVKGDMSKLQTDIYMFLK